MACSKLNHYMKKIFIIFVLILLPLQYSWALAANYDLHAKQDTEAHFGHHNHDIEHKNAKNDVDDKKSHTEYSHQHYGFSHLSCNELLKPNLPSFAPQANIFFCQSISFYHSPPNSTLDRPNWRAAV